MRPSYRGLLFGIFTSAEHPLSQNEGIVRGNVYALNILPTFLMYSYREHVLLTNTFRIFPSHESQFPHQNPNILRGT